MALPYMYNTFSTVIIIVSLCKFTTALAWLSTVLAWLSTALGAQQRDMCTREAYMLAAKLLEITYADNTKLYLVFPQIKVL